MHVSSLIPLRPEQWLLVGLTVLIGGGCSRAGFTSPADAALDQSCADGAGLDIRVDLPLDSRADLPPDLPAPGDLRSADQRDAGAGAWRSLPGSTSGFGLTQRATKANTVSLATGPTGALYHAWSDAHHAGTSQVYLRRWDGANWSEFDGSGSGGGVSNSTAVARLGRLVVDANDHPWLCWFEHGAQRHVYLRRYDGSSWQEVAGSATDGGISGHVNAWWPQLGLVQGVPFVAWERYNAPGTLTGAIHAKRRAGPSWEQIAGSTTQYGVSTSGEDSQRLRMAVSGSSVHLLWHVLGAQPELRYRRLDGSSWQAVETLSVGAPPRRDGHLALMPSGEPVVAWQQDTTTGTEIRVARRAASGWIDLGAASGDFVDADQSMIVVTAGGTIYVGFRVRDALGFNIHVRRLGQTGWVTPGGPLPNGISASAEPSSFPVGHVGAGRLYVSWEETIASDQSVVYLRYFDSP